ncbi:MAG: DMT family transporter [Neisseriaceae bacterium]|nr:DMT family transporter [Neisseriaceae bacterium]
MNAYWRGTLDMTMAMIISGTVGWFVLQTHLPAQTVVFWRCLFGAVAMLLVCLSLGLLKPASFNRRQLLWMVLGALALVLNWTLLFAAYRHTSIAVTTVVYHTQPFILVLLSLILFKEALGRHRLAWLTLAFMGMLLIVLGKPSLAEVSGDYLTGLGLALGAAFFYAIAALITKRLQHTPPQLIVLLQLSLGALLLAPFAQLGTLPQNPTTWGLLLTIGVLHTGLMSTLLYGALQKIPTALVGTLSFIYPIVAILVDWLALGQRLSPIQLVGTLVILIAAAGMTLMPQWRQRQQAKPSMRP